MKKLLFSSCLMLAAMTAVVQAQEPAKETPKSAVEAAQAEAKKALAEAKERATEAAKAAAAAAIEAGKAAEGTASGEKKVEVQIKATGKVVKVGPDGKVEVIDLEGGDGKSMIPAGAKEHIQLMLKKAHEAGAQDAGGAKEGTHKVESNVIVSDGKVTGKIVIVGPDGKPQVKEFNLSGTGVDGGAMKAVEEILKSNTQLPAEAAKQLEHVFRSTLGGDGERRVLAIGGGGKTAEQLDAVSAKLDKILSRLDALEKEISELKASK